MLESLFRMLNKQLHDTTVIVEKYYFFRAQFIKHLWYWFNWSEAHFINQ